MIVWFGTTRTLIASLGDWLSILTAPLLPGQPFGGSDSESQLAESSASALLIAKAVRMTSGIHAALLLVDSGFVTEAACMLRIVSDLGMEVTAVAEGVLSGTMTSAQRKFVDQFLQPRPRTPEEYLERAKQRYVGRKELLTSDLRMANDAGLDGEKLRRQKEVTNAVLDGYVHGAYATAMELFYPDVGKFLVEGETAPEHRLLHMVAVAGKIHEVLYSFLLIAETQGNHELMRELLAAIKELDDSQEYDGETYLGAGNEP
jgi:hypothetical protein